jgi:hypothetical protein
MSGKQIRGAIAGISPVSEREARLLAESPDDLEKEIIAQIDAWVDKTVRLVGSTEKPPKRKLVGKFRQRGRSSLLDQYRHLFPTKSNEELATIAGCTKANVRAYRIRWFKQPVLLRLVQQIADNYERFAGDPAVCGSVARATKSQYEAFVGAGFTADQALTLTSAWVSKAFHVPRPG